MQSILLKKKCDPKRRRGENERLYIYIKNCVDSLLWFEKEEHG